MIVQSLVSHKVAAAALAIALGGTSAAAATGNLPIVQEDPVELTEDTTSDSEIEADENESENEPKEEVLPPVNAEGVEYGDVLCADAKNHGQYVSGVAKDDTIEGNRGEIVSQAAKTNCGKADKAEAKAERDAEKAERDEAKAAEKAERDAEKAERKANESEDEGSAGDRSDDSDSDDDVKKDKPNNGNGKKN
ncbi:MAG: hypothetical protein HKN03_05275 [Acidimicrobiales bacterium]|nr:hypothetical protein [Acidimicrobiales bacterium]